MQQINATDFQKEVLESPIPVLVDFFAEWCGPCKMQAPVLQELSGTWKGKVKIIKVDVDQNNDLAGQFGVMSIPTLIVFKAGKPQNQMIGFQQKEKLESLFSEITQ
jgi:thioredoxin 1